MPLATTRWPGHRGAVDGKALSRTVDISDSGKQSGNGLPCVASGIFVDAGHVAACARHHWCVVHGIDRERCRAGGSREDFFTAGIATDSLVVARHRARCLVPGVEGDAAGHRTVPVGSGYKAHAVGAVKQQRLAAVGGEIKDGPGTSSHFVLPGAVCVVHRRDSNRLGHAAAQIRVGNTAIGNQLRHGVTGAGAVVLVDGGKGCTSHPQHRRVIHRRQVDIAVAGIADVILDVGRHHRDVALRGDRCVRTVGVADGAQRQLVVIGWQITRQGDGAGAAAAHSQAGDTVPVGAIAARNGQGLAAGVLHIADADHHLLQVAVLVGDGGIGCHDLDRRAAFGVRSGERHATCYTIGVHRRCPHVGDGAGGADGGRCCGVGASAVHYRHRHRARARECIGVGVLVGDGLDDVLVLGPGARAADADAGGATVADDDVAERAGHGNDP